MVARSEEDVKMIEEQAEQLVKLKGEVSYYKQELIDARSRKAAAEDELNTVEIDGQLFLVQESGGSISLLPALTLLQPPPQPPTQAGGQT